MDFDFISEKGKVQENELCSLVKKYSSDNSYMLYVYTTKFGCEKVGQLNDIEHLLELRVFDENSELKAVRSQIGKPFHYRYIDDNAFKEKLKSIEDEFDGSFKNRTLEDEQYLDVNKRKTDGIDYVSIGGGHYTMPAEKLEKVKILNYLYIDENSGILKIADFRIVDFVRRVGE